MIGSLSLAGGFIPRQKKKISRGKIYDWLSLPCRGINPPAKEKNIKGKKYMIESPPLPGDSSPGDYRDYIMKFLSP